MPDDDSRYRAISALLSMKSYREAAECYRRALEIDPECRIARKGLSDVECILKDDPGSP